MMQKLWIATVVGVFVTAQMAIADEPERLRKHAGDLKRQAVELMERGEKEAAERLLREAAKLNEQAQILAQKEKQERTKPRPEPELRERELQNLHARLKELHMAHRALWEGEAPEPEMLDIRRRIQHVEAEIATLEGHPHPEALKHMENQLLRIQHMRHAAEHLQAAEMPDISQALREKSMQMERAVKERLEQMEREAAHIPPAPHPGERAVEEALRDEVQALRKEVERLRKEARP